MASGVASVWVPVDDMDRARAFYRDTLGLDEGKTGDDWPARAPADSPA